MKKLNTKSIVMLGVLTAFVIIFSTTPIGSIPIGPLVITLNIIPIALASITLGTTGSVIIGAVFGIFSFLQASGVTVFFMTSLVTLYGKTEYLQNMIDGRNILIFILAFVGVNAVTEMISSTVIAGAVGVALQKAKLVQTPTVQAS